MIGKPFLFPEDPLDRGLIIDWRLDRNTGLVLPDSSGNAGHITSGTAITNGEWVPTRYGPGWQCAVNENAETNIDTRDFGIPFTWTAITLECFFRMDQLHGSWPIVPTLSFWQVDGGPTSIAIGYAMKGDTNDRVHRVVLNDTLVQFTGTKSRPANGDYVHVLTTYDGEYVRGYREGVADGSTAATGTIDGDDYNRHKFFLNVLTSSVAHGVTILQARIYDRALTLTEARQRYRICLARASGLKSQLWMIPFLTAEEAVAGAVPVIADHYRRLRT